MADRAIALYKKASSNQKLVSSNSTSHSLDEIVPALENSVINQDLCEQDKNDHNLSIQMGILIKAYGQLGDMDMAFEIFKGNQISTQKPIVNNDITFGCLIDACVRNGHI